MFQIQKKKIELYQCLLDETRDFYLALSSSTHGLFSFSPSRFESNLNCLCKKKNLFELLNTISSIDLRERRIRTDLYFFNSIFFSFRWTRSKHRQLSRNREPGSLLFHLPSNARIIISFVKNLNHSSSCYPILFFFSFFFLFSSISVRWIVIRPSNRYISGFGENKWCSRRFYTKLVFEFSRNFLEISVKSEWWDRNL